MLCPEKMDQLCIWAYYLRHPNGFVSPILIFSSVLLFNLLELDTYVIYHTLMTIILFYVLPPSLFGRLLKHNFSSMLKLIQDCIICPVNHLLQIHH